MNFLSARHRLAVTAIVDVALNSTATPVSSKAIAGRLNTNPRHFETMFQVFVHAKLLKSVRGPKGGYSLARDPAKISVADVLKSTHSYASGSDDPVSKLFDEIINPTVAKAATPFMENLGKVTVAELVQQARKLKLEAA